MPKTEAELRDWVVQHNKRTTHDRSLSSAYGYNRILDADLATVCSELRSQFEPPIRVLDVGCGNGKALTQLAESLKVASIDPDDFEFWGIGVNRYETMQIIDDRLIIAGVWDHDFQGQQFHLVFSVFAFHYLWHKLEALEKIHNDLLVEGGRAFLHFPGYLVRFGEDPAVLAQNEQEGNHKFRDFLLRLEAEDDICPMNFTTIPNFSDDDDCTLLAEFGHVRFAKQQQEPISFGKDLHAFGMFDDGFTFDYMNKSERTYVTSYYGESDGSENHFADNQYLSHSPNEELHRTVRQRSGSYRLSDGSYFRGPYHITSEPLEVAGRNYELNVAVHEYDSDRVVLICPGACEPLKGRIVPYAELAEAIVQAELGAVVRYSDPYDFECDYQEYLLAKTRLMIEFALEIATQTSCNKRPRLSVMAYSSSAGAVAALATEYEIESLLLVAPSHDLETDRILPGYQSYQGKVRILVGEADQVVLPQQAFWYCENAKSAASREYVEARCCGHSFEGAENKNLFFHGPLWAFGSTRPQGFPLPREEPSEAWN